jgi:hypothetical protein
MSKSGENPFTKGNIEFVVGPKRPKLASFKEIGDTFPPMRSTSLVEGTNYLVFSKGPLSPSYKIVTYLSTNGSSGDITVKELFETRDDNKRGWFNIPKLMRGSKHHKEETVYRANHVFTSMQQFNALSSYDKKNIHIFNNLGDRAAEFNEDMEDKAATDVIEEIIAEYNESEEEEEDEEGEEEESDKGKGKGKMSKLYSFRTTRRKGRKGRKSKKAKKSKRKSRRCKK